MVAAVAQNQHRDDPVAFNCLGPVAKMGLDMEVRDFMLEAIENICDWIPYFSNDPQLAKSASVVGENVNLAKNALAPLALVNKVGQLRDHWSQLSISDSREISCEIAKNGCLLGKEAAGSAMFLDAVNVVSLKDSMNVAKGVFWAGLLGFDVISFFQHVGNASHYRAQRAEAQNEGLKNVLGHKENLAYLRIVQSVTTIAMASIALVSILFASIAVGWLFSPVVMIGLTSIWLTLNYMTHFYDLSIQSWDKALAPGLA